ncbi:MAG: hypothetical protein Q6L68_10140 [Thermostichus sp. DG02_5_bins_236]
MFGTWYRRQMGRFEELGQVETWQGVALMLLATGCFASLGAIIRLNSPAIHPFQIVFLRNLFGFLTLSPLVLQAGIQSLRTAKVDLYSDASKAHVFQAWDVAPCGFSRSFW